MAKVRSPAAEPRTERSKPTTNPSPNAVTMRTARSALVGIAQVSQTGPEASVVAAMSSGRVGRPIPVSTTVLAPNHPRLPSGHVTLSPSLAPDALDQYRREL